MSGRDRFDFADVRIDTSARSVAAVARACAGAHRRMACPYRPEPVIRSSGAGQGGCGQDVYRRASLGDRHAVGTLRFDTDRRTAGEVADLICARTGWPERAG